VTISTKRATGTNIFPRTSCSWSFACTTELKRSGIVIFELHKAATVAIAAILPRNNIFVWVYPWVHLLTWQQCKQTDCAGEGSGEECWRFHKIYSFWLLIKSRTGLDRW
jgi:hypothetical protein